MQNQVIVGSAFSQLVAGHEQALAERRPGAMEVALLLVGPVEAKPVSAQSEVQRRRQFHSFPQQRGEPRWRSQEIGFAQ